MSCSTIALTTLSVLAPAIREDLPFSAFQLGLAVTFMFVVGGSASPLAGRVVDAFGPRKALLLLFTTSAAALALLAGSQSYGMIAAGLALAGWALALGNPATNQVVAEQVVRTRQGIVTGIKQSGVPLGGLITGTLLPSIARLANWRVAVLSILALPLVGMLGASRTVPDAAGRRRARRTRAAASRRPPSMVRWLTAYSPLMGGAMAVVNVHVPLYAFEHLSWRMETAGLLAAVIGVTGITARIVTGRLATAQRPLPPVLTVLTIGAMCSAGLVALSTVGSGVLLVVGVVGLGWCGVAWNAVAMIALVQRLSVHETAAASGRVLRGFFFGVVVAPAAFGVAVDTTGSYVGGWSFIVGMYLAATLLTLTWWRSEASGYNAAAS